MLRNCSKSLIFSEFSEISRNSSDTKFWKFWEKKIYLQHGRRWCRASASAPSRRSASRASSSMLWARASRPEPVSLSRISFMNFRRLVLGCMDTSDSESSRIFQHFSSSTQFLKWICGFLQTFAYFFKISAPHTHRKRKAHSSGGAKCIFGSTWTVGSLEL